MDNEPRFPPELERQIFETTAIQHPSAIPSLLRIAHRVALWVEPFLYRAVRFQDSPVSHSLVKAIQSGSKPSSFFCIAVRHLCLYDFWDMDNIAAVLKLCTGVVDLSVSFQYTTLMLLTLLGGMRPRRLSISLRPLFGSLDFDINAAPSIDAAHPLFTHVTHLDVSDPVEIPPETYAIFPAFPALTHLCLNSAHPWDAIGTVLTSCPSLTLLVNLWGPKAYELELARQHAQDIPFRDARFVIEFVEDDYWKEWDAGAEGLPNFWTRAEHFVAKKHRG